MSAAVAAVAGFGVAGFKRKDSRSAEELALRATLEAFRGSGADRGGVGVAYVGTTYGEPGMGQRVLKDLGLSGVPIHNLENACSSGADAVLHAARAVEHGEVPLALAIGVDAPTVVAASGPLPLSEADPFVRMGATAPAIYALRATSYLARHGLPAGDLAHVSVKNRRHAALTPWAPFDEPVDVEAVLASPMISEPLTRLQCCPVIDGAAAVLVARADRSPGSARILGAALRSGTLQDVPGAADTVTRRAAEAAFEGAGITAADLDACEVHDAFTIGEVLAIEALGICEAGSGLGYVASGKASLGGRGVVVNPGGGLLGRGHPPGATGALQVVEAALQVTGRAGGRQVEGARLVACHTRGGGSFDLDANACAVIVVGR